MHKLIFFLAFLSPSIVFAQKKDKRLTSEISQLINGYHGNIGISIKNLRTGKTVSINADSTFPTASIVKIPILLGIMNKVDKGELNIGQHFTYNDSLLYAGEDILGSFKNGEKISLHKLMMLMLSMSDNTASLWLQSIAGGGSKINTLLENLGYIHTKVNSRTEGREADRKILGWGQTTPKEMLRIFESIYNNKLISDSASTFMLRMLGRNYWDGEGLSAIPPSIEVQSKNGAVDASRSEVMLVNAHRNPYILSIFTKNNADKSWADSNEAWVLTRKISALLWKHWGVK